MYEDGSIPLPRIDFDALPTGEGCTDDVLFEDPIGVGAMLVEFDMVVCANWTDDELRPLMSQAITLRNNVGQLEDE